ETGTADRDVGGSLTPGAAEGVADDHGNVYTGQLPQPDAQPVGGRIGILRQQNDGVWLGRVRGIDAGGGADEAVPGLRDDERRPCSDEASALAQDHLEPAGILLPGQLARLGGWLYRGQPDDPTFGLGDNFVRDNDHVAVLELHRSRDQLAD